MIWGYAGPWYREFLNQGEDRLYARLKFLKAHGLKVTGEQVRTVAEMSDSERDRLGQYLVDHDLHLTPHIGIGCLESDRDRVKQNTEAAIDGLQKYLPLMRGEIVMTGAGGGHRFDRVMPLEDKIDRMSAAFAPLADACRELGAPLGIENHGGFYCADLVVLCERTPHMHIFLDVGNTYLIGEQPIPAFQIAAPYTIGTHFKDHRVCPRMEARPLHFEIAGSTLGDGDVPLRACYDLLLSNAPNPDRLVMEIEMIRPDDLSAPECLEKSLAFIRSLPEVSG